MKRFVVFFVFIFLILALFVLAAEKVDINTDPLEELDKITGIGPALAQRIIDSRPFSSLDDLLRVKGIGEKTLQKIKEQEMACVDCLPGSSLREASQSDEAIPNSENEIASGAAVAGPRNDEPITYPSGIFINEIMPSPEGPDEDNEWIELYNSNSSEVNLSGWKIQDIAGTQTTYTIPEGIKILGSSFLVFDRSETKIVLNNTEDGLRLFTPDNKDVDFVSYTKAPLSQSYNKINSGWQWSGTVTPNSTNVIFSSSAKNDLTNLPKTEDSAKNNDVRVGLAGVSQSINSSQDGKNLNPWFLFFTAFTLTIISASITLFIKFKFLNKKQ